MNKINQRTLNLVKEFEGYGDKMADGRCVAYLDRNATPANSDYDRSAGGLWTIGYGATGSGVCKGTIWTQSMSDSDLSARLNQKGMEILSQLTVPVNDNQYGALCSAAYNLGTHGIHGILDLINAGDMDAAARSFMNYNHGHENGQLVVMAGLTRRRHAEMELFQWEVPGEVKQISPPLQQADQVQAATAVGGFSIAGLWNYLPQVKEFMTDHNGLILLGAMGLTFGVTYLWKWHMQNEFNKGTYVPVGTQITPELDPNVV